MAAKAPRNDAKTKAPADAPVAAPDESTATAGEASTTETGSSPAGEAVSQEAVAAAGGETAVVGPAASEGPQDAGDDAAEDEGSGRPQLTGATLFLDSHRHLLSDVSFTVPELRELARYPEPAPVCSVAAPNGPRWRAGMQFGPEAVNVSRAELGADPDATLKSLQADPHLRVGPPIGTE
ncbi:hypothetical protein [Camelimonas lactis]|uniref:Uncharacterized protein n=1 Tax=Camelimonas lactis TaxID=659006 RepID=A0A4R2GRK1_9HYPH|nr:hypothetical protein [Camelimonas lactis]TCO12436.1 hypothetical protein EV666_10983 [Camelimonas lactis]